MSLVRFGEDDSDVYVFETGTGALECSGCELAARPGIDSFSAGTDHGAMLAHLAEHRAAGHVVPGYVDEVIRQRTF